VTEKISQGSVENNDEKNELLFGLSADGRKKAGLAIWDECVRRAMACTACGLSETRGAVVFGEGSEETNLMFIGEGPGADEDDQGRPFVGKAGQLLTQILRAVGIDRSEVYITNVVNADLPTTGFLFQRRWRLATRSCRLRYFS
jgi:DNA polymerase